MKRTFAKGGWECASEPSQACLCFSTVPPALLCLAWTACLSFLPTISRGTVHRGGYQCICTWMHPSRQGWSTSRGSNPKDHRPCSTSHLVCLSFVLWPQMQDGPTSRGIPFTSRTDVRFSFLWNRKTVGKPLRSVPDANRIQREIRKEKGNEGHLHTCCGPLATWTQDVDAHQAHHTRRR